MVFKTLASEPLYSGKAFQLYVDSVQAPNGMLMQLEIIKHPNAVTILPVDNQNIWFVRQYRHAAGLEMLELPAGTLEEGEKPLLCAHREIREEIGMSAQEMNEIGGFYLAPGYSSEYLYAFLARGLKPNPLPGDVDEFIQVETMPIEQAYQLAESGQINDGKTLATLMLARPLIYNK
ncbi:MAG: NUDIX hydrolase [Anaerolineales bacterium]|nr:NUDIX hydrolase [Anaerolineales bacterium]